VLQINVYYVNKPPPCLVKHLVGLKETGSSKAKSGLKKGFYDENCEGFSQPFCLWLSSKEELL
jgi:hypothetical protein